MLAIARCDGTTVAHSDLNKLTPIGVSRMRLRSIKSYFAVCAVTLGILVLTCAASNAWAQSPAAGGAARPPYNIIFVISDQEADHLLAEGDFELPARAELRRRGFDFRNHYAAAAMCTPSRAAFISGTPPQVNGVFDQMETGYVPRLRTDRPNMGSVLKGLGYTTAYFGKFELTRGCSRSTPRSIITLRCSRMDLISSILTATNSRRQIKDIKSTAITSAKQFAGCARMLRH